MTQPFETVSETAVTFTITVSGLSFWPSRDPIEEESFFFMVPEQIKNDIENILLSMPNDVGLDGETYSFVINNPANTIDYLGLDGTIGGCTPEGSKLYQECMDITPEEKRKHNEECKKACEALSDTAKGIILAPVVPASRTTGIVKWFVRGGKWIVGKIWKKTDPGEKFPDNKPKIQCPPKQ